MEEWEQLDRLSQNISAEPWSLYWKEWKSGTKEFEAFLHEPLAHLQKAFKHVGQSWNVQTKGVGIFGGFDDKTIHPKPDPNVKTPQLVITGSTVFGGMSVTN